MSPKKENNYVTFQIFFVWYESHFFNLRVLFYNLRTTPSGSEREEEEEERNKIPLKVATSFCLQRLKVAYALHSDQHFYYIQSRFETKCMTMGGLPKPQGNFRTNYYTIQLLFKELM